MKNILTIISVLFSFGCKEVNQNPLDKTKDVSKEIMNDENFTVVTIDSCEYVVYSDYHGLYNSYSSGITHKGNCKFCQNKKAPSGKE